MFAIPVGEGQTATLKWNKSVMMKLTMMQVKKDFARQFLTCYTFCNYKIYHTSLDGLTDCHDPECCHSPSCSDSLLCTTVTDPSVLAQNLNRTEKFHASFWDRFGFLATTNEVQQYARVDDMDKE